MKASGYSRENNLQIKIPTTEVDTATIKAIQ